MQNPLKKLLKPKKEEKKPIGWVKHPETGEDVFLNRKQRRKLTRKWHGKI